MAMQHAGAERNCSSLFNRVMVCLAVFVATLEFSSTVTLNASVPFSVKEIKLSIVKIGVNLFTIHNLISFDVVTRNSIHHIYIFFSSFGAHHPL